MNVSDISSSVMATASMAAKQQASLDLQVKMLKQIADSQEQIMALLASAGVGEVIDTYA